MAYEGKVKIIAFTDLDAWKVGHALVLAVYEVTDGFSNREMFNLTSQIRRSALSITSNIAEGFSRRSFREKLQFYSVALGSLTELQNQLILAKDVQYVDGVAYEKIHKQVVRVHRLIRGLMKYSKTKINDP